MYYSPVIMSPRKEISPLGLWHKLQVSSSTSNVVLEFPPGVLGNVVVGVMLVGTVRREYR